MNDDLRAIIADPNQATTHWLTEVLSRSKALRSGRVTCVRRELVLEYNSSIYRLHLTYSTDADPDAPSSVILKIKSGEGARDELAIGQQFAPHQKDLPMLMSWYDAGYSDERKVGHFLMRDLSASHAQTVNVGEAIAGRGVPRQHQLEQIIDCIAQFHAYWWQHPDLDRVIGPIHGGYRNAEVYEREVIQSREAQYAQFLSDHGNDLPDDVKRTLDRALPSLRVLYERHIGPRIAARENVTLIHGDCYFGQFLCPKDAASDQIYLIDLESANTFLAAIDLAFLFATFWTLQQRHENDRELKCLRRYHEKLIASGVRGFDLDRLFTDYRTAVAMMIFYPIWDCVIGGSRRAYWWPKLQCLTAAYRDWKCEEIGI